jgi:hypothetical protein
MGLNAVAAGETIQIADINDFKDHLEGGAGKTVAYYLKTATSNDFKIQLADNAGAQKFSVEDSDGTEIFRITSDGDVQFDGGLDVAKGRSEQFQTTTTKNANTTLGDVTGSDITVAAGEEYWFEYQIAYNSGTTPDIKLNFSLPTNYEIYAETWAPNTALTYVKFLWTGASPSDAAIGGTGALNIINIRGMIYDTTGSDSGTLKLQMAQNTSNASDTTIIANQSYVKYGIINNS